MSAEFFELRLNIFLRDISAVAGKTIVIFLCEREQALADSRVVRCVATFAGVVRDIVPVRVRPRVHPRAVPCFG